MNDESPRKGALDDDAKAMLAAFRRQEQMPADLHERVWARVEQDTADATVVPGRWQRRVAIGAMAAAAAVALVWVMPRSMWATTSTDASTQASHQGQIERASGHASPGVQRQTVGKTERDDTEVAPRDPAPPSTVDVVPTDAPPVPHPSTNRGPGRVPPRDRQPSTDDAPTDDAPTDDAPPTPSPARTSSLGEEIALIERARQALLRNAPDQAVTILAEHAKRFPSGAMAQERRALRAIATCQSEGPAAGHALARAFVLEHPSAALTDRVRAVCEIP